MNFGANLVHQISTESHPVSGLRNALQDHETLPSSCRRYNYKPGFPKFADVRLAKLEKAVEEQRRKNWSLIVVELEQCFYIDLPSLVWNEIGISGVHWRSMNL
jgi:hypothetical protein